MTTAQSHILVDRLSETDLLQRVLYRDGLILVVNKPAGLAVHKGGPSIHNLEQYFHWLTFGLPNAPVLAHRLDRGTSGCLVLARHARAARMMQELFTAGHIKKTYFAWVHGTVAPDEGRIDRALKRMTPEKWNWRMKADPLGQAAITDFQVVTRTNASTLLKLMPHTGRTHQLRVHCKELGHPILGDAVYAGDLPFVSKLHLHAAHIEIPLYPKKASLTISAPWPEHMMHEGFCP